MSMTIAKASGYRKGALRWTELFITDETDAAGPRYRATVIGETTIAGEERRVRERVFSTVKGALDWSGFDHSSKLYETLRKAALVWLEERSTDTPLLNTSGGAVVVSLTKPLNIEDARVGDVFDVEYEGEGYFRLTLKKGTIG